MKAAFDALPPKTREDLLRAFSIMSGGFAYLSAGGDEARIHAKVRVGGTVTGLVLIMTTHAISDLVVKTFMDVPLPPPATPPTQKDPCETPPAPAPDAAPPDGLD